MPQRHHQPEPIDMEAVGAELLAALERRRTNRLPDAPPRVISAHAIARHFKIRPLGTPDSRKRGVRLVIDYLRMAGHQVEALTGSDGGYYLPSSAADTQAYADARRSGGLAHLAAAARAARHPAAADAQGQLLLPINTESKHP